MVADAYYTSPIGMNDLGFMGNGAMSDSACRRKR